MTRNKFVQLRDSSSVVGERAPQIGAGLPYARVSLTNSTLDSSGHVRRRLGPAPGRETSPEHLTVTRSAPSAKTKTAASDRKTKAKRTKADVARITYPCHKKTFRATTSSSAATRQRRSSGKSRKSHTNDTDLSHVISSRLSPTADYKRPACPKVNHRPEEASVRVKDLNASQDDPATFTRAWTPLASKSKASFRRSYSSVVNIDASFDRQLPRSNFHADQPVSAAESPEASTARAERHTMGRSTVATQTSSPLTPQPVDQYAPKSPRRKGPWMKPTTHGTPDDVGSSVYLQFCKDSFVSARTSDVPTSSLSIENVKAFERLTAASSDGRWRRKGIESWVSEVNSSRSLDTDASTTANTRGEEPSNTDSSGADLRPMSRLLSRHRLQQNAVCDSAETHLAATGSGELLRARLLEARQRAKSYREQQQRQQQQQQQLKQQQQQQGKSSRADAVTDGGTISRDSPTTEIPRSPGEPHYVRATQPSHSGGGWRPRHSEDDRLADSRVSTSFHLNNVTTMLQGKRPPCASSPTGSLHDMPKRPAILHASELIARLRRERRTVDRMTKSAKKSERRSGTSGGSNGARSSEKRTGDSTANFDDGDRIRKDERRRKESSDAEAKNSGVLAALLAASSRAPENADTERKLPTPIKPQQSAYYKYYQQYYSRHCKDNADKAGERNEACKVM